MFQILPEEFGGSCGKFDNSECFETIMAMKEYFEGVKRMADDNKGVK